MPDRATCPAHSESPAGGLIDREIVIDNAKVVTAGFVKLVDDRTDVVLLRPWKLPQK